MSLGGNMTIQQWLEKIMLNFPYLSQNIKDNYDVYVEINEPDMLFEKILMSYKFESVQ